MCVVSAFRRTHANVRLKPDTTDDREGEAQSRPDAAKPRRSVSKSRFIAPST
jgi:hypothetical protein